MLCTGHSDSCPPVWIMQIYIMEWDSQFTLPKNWHTNCSAKLTLVQICKERIHSLKKKKKLGRTPEAEQHMRVTLPSSLLSLFFWTHSPSWTWQRSLDADKWPCSSRVWTVVCHCSGDIPDICMFRTCGCCQHFHPDGQWSSSTVFKRKCVGFQVALSNYWTQWHWAPTQLRNTHKPKLACFGFKGFHKFWLWKRS